MILIFKVTYMKSFLVSVWLFNLDTHVHTHSHTHTHTHTHTLSHTQADARRKIPIHNFVSRFLVSLYLSIRKPQVHVFSIRKQTCKPYITPNLMIWEKLFVWETFCHMTSKLALVCRMKISGAWHAFHVIAEMEWVHRSVTIGTRTLNVYQKLPSYEVTRSSKYDPFSCFGNIVVMSFHFCSGIKCMPWSWYFHHAYQC